MIDGLRLTVTGEELGTLLDRRNEWRARVLEFLRRHTEAGEVYRLDEADLTFGELLPDRPGWLEQQDYEERTSVGFNLGRVARCLGALTPMALPIATGGCVAEG